jgi:PAS domain S-box-containing protein
MIALFQNLPLRGKMTLIGVLSSLTALIASGGASLLSEYASSRQEFSHRHSILAQVTADNSTAALAFEGRRDARQILNALAAEPSITVAILYNNRGEIFVEYHKQTRTGVESIESPQAPGYRFGPNALHVHQVVREGEEIFGALYLQADLAEISQRIQTSILRLLVFLLVASGLAAALAYRLQQSVSKPILDLAALAERVREGRFLATSAPEWRDHDFEIPGNDGDEVGKLTTSFYLMLRELREREGALRESEANYRMLTEQASDGIAITHVNGKIISINQAASHLLGYSLEEATEMSVNDLLDTSDLSVRPLDLETLQGGKAVLSEQLFRKKDGSPIWIETNTKMLEDGRIQAILRDLSSRKRLEDQLRQSQKMEAVGQLAGGIAHDFNNLLTAIGGFSEQIVLYPDQDPRPFAEEVIRASDRAADLTRQLLAFGRQQHLEPEVLKLTGIVSDLEKMLVRTIGEDVELKTELEPKLDSVRADPGQIEQMIVNMAVNARDAMPNGGHLLIRTENVDMRGHQSIPSGAYVKLSVTDDGEGITPENLDRIFDPFFTTKPPGKGTGLGLATLYGIAKQSGGYVTVDSVVGEGTTFDIFLPRCKEAVREPGLEIETLAAERGSEHILLVEDEELVRRFTRLALQGLGYTVLEASNGEEALRIAKDYEPTIALLLTDLIMPGMNGVELAKEITEIQSEIRVVIMSGYAGDELERRGARDLQPLTKPFTHQALARRIREALDN